MVALRAEASEVAEYVVPNPEIDEIDKAIIEQLQVDGRMPYSQLAPVVGLSEAATRQRVNRLVDGGVMQIVAVSDPARVGLHAQAMAGIKVRGDLRPVAVALASIRAVEYVVVTSGRFDILVELVCATMADLFDLLNDSIRPIEGVDEVELFTYLQLVKQTYTWGTG